MLTGGAFHVVADDEMHLGVFDEGGLRPGSLVPLFPGDLPAAQKSRKKTKPDCESLLKLPRFKGYPHGALLALGSGSRPNRCRGSLLPLDAKGVISGSARYIDCADLYDGLGVADLNIEGAYVADGELFLLQRGHRRSSNARIRLPLRPFLASLASGSPAPIRPRMIEAFDLGEIHGISLGFTDAAALPHGRMLFTAVAEDTSDGYRDGPCKAAAIGIARRNGSIEFLGLLRPAWKVEGVVAWMKGKTVHMRLVTDADDPSRPAVLLAGEISIA